MTEYDKSQKKTGEKKPTAFRIDNETADKLRLLCKDFPNQDVAFNALMAAYEREMLITTQSQYAEDIRKFEQYQQCLSAKFTDILKALTTADERAQIEVQQLLDSKDAVIQDLQKRIEDARRSREAYESMFDRATKEKKELEEKLEKEQLENQGLRAEMKEKEAQMNASLQDKIQLNDILTKSVAEKQQELDKRAKYPEMIEEKETQIKALADRVRELEDSVKESEYAHRLELLEKDKQAEAERAELRQKHEDRMNALREKYEAELEKLREKNETAQSRIQELMAGK
ncbi:MAG: hypothetical protein K2K21_10645 [Lachnospiraceae bacterium]|nr:hypothetical protein [Lachnospiraceae bacterium]